MAEVSRLYTIAMPIILSTGEVQEKAVQGIDVETGAKAALVFETRDAAHSYISAMQLSHTSPIEVQLSDIPMFIREKKEGGIYFYTLNPLHQDFDKRWHEIDGLMTYPNLEPDA